MKVLFATPRTPFPPDEGDQLVAWEQIRRLGAGFEIALVTLRTDLDGPAEAVARQALAPHCRRVHVLSRGRDFRRAARTLVNRKPMMVNLFWDQGLAREMDAVLAEEKPDLVHVQTIHMAEYLRNHRGAAVLDMVDALSLNLSRRVPFERFPRKLAYAVEARLLRRYEDEAMRRFARVLCVSADDATAYPGAAIVANPNGTSVTRERVAAASAGITRERSLVFHGTLHYFPNVDALRWLCAEIWPRLATAHPDLSLRIVGRNPKPDVQALADGRRVVVTGAVPDVVPELCRASIGVYPIRTGTGMKNKVIEALACALPVVASPEAVSGLPYLRSDDHYLRAATADEWVAAVSRLLGDAALCARLGAAGQEAALAHHSWDDNAARLAATWRGAVKP